MTAMSAAETTPVKEVEATAAAIRSFVVEWRIPSPSQYFAKIR